MKIKRQWDPVESLLRNCRYCGRHIKFLEKYIQCDDYKFIHCAHMGCYVLALFGHEDGMYVVHLY